MNGTDNEHIDNSADSGKMSVVSGETASDDAFVIDGGSVESGGSVEAVKTGRAARRIRQILAPERRYLILCFAVPAVIMLLIYIAMGVWPVANNSVLVLDLNAQYVYYIEKLRSIITDGGSFLYTFQRALGGEFMGIVAYYLASPFNLITVLFPKQYITEALLLILVLKCGASGLTFGIYVHNTRDKRRPVMTVMFSAMYALSAFAVVMQSNLMWTENIICLPMIMLGIDRLIKYGRFKTFTIFLSIAIITNFYIGYMTCLFVAIYFFVRYFSMAPEERNPRSIRAHFPKSLLNIAAFSIIAVMISAVMILSAYYSLTFGKLEFSTPNWKPEQMYDFIKLLSKIYFGSYDTVRPEGMPFLYCGMLMPLLLPLFFVSPNVKMRKKICGGIILLIFAVSFTLSSADLVWHGFQRPNWLNARFTFMFVMLVLLMSYDALVGLKETGKKYLAVTGGATLLILIILQSMKLENMPTFICVWASIGLVFLYSAMLPAAAGALSEGKIRGSSIAVASVVCVELALSGVANLYAFDQDVVFSYRSSYRNTIDAYTEAKNLVNDDGFYRSEKLYHRKSNDNFALGFNGLSNSTSTLNKSVIDLLQKFGFTSKSHWSKYTGGTLISDSLFGIKYLYIDSDAKKSVTPQYVSDYYELLGTSSGGIKVYRNPFALSVAFGTDGTFSSADLEGANPFEVMNDVFSSVYPDVEEASSFWKPLETLSSDYSGCRRFGVEQNHTGYESSYDGNAYVTYEFEAESSDCVYMFIPSKWPREADIAVNGKGAGKYFTNDTHAIKELGSFEPGEHVTVKLTLEEEKLYVSNEPKIFYYFDKEAFDSVKDSLVSANMVVAEHSEDSLEGTITVDENTSTVLLTIPYDEGWKISVDGERISYGKALGSLITFDLTPGTHDIKMVYRPDCVIYGSIVSLTGIVIFAAACVIEKLTRQQREDRRREKKMSLAANEPEPPEPPELPEE